MKIRELLREFDNTYVPNPLNGGKLSAETYEAMDIINDIEGDLMEEVSATMPGKSVQDRVRAMRETIRGLGKVTTMPITKLVPFEPEYNPDHIARIQSAPADVYLLSGKYYVNDGNHRVIAAHLNGKQTVSVNLIDTADIIAKTDEMFVSRQRKSA